MKQTTDISIMKLVVICSPNRNQFPAVNINLCLCFSLGPCSSAHICLGCSCAGGYCSRRWKEPRPPQTRAAGNHSDPELSGKSVPELPLLPPSPPALLGWNCPLQMTSDEFIFYKF